MPPTIDTLKVERSIDIVDSKKRRELLAFCYSACRIDGQCLGWLPRAAYDEAHQQGRICAVWNNDDLVGFALWSTDNGELRCLQIWVRPDARLLLHGAALIAFLDEAAAHRGCYRLRLWCAVDLAANVFWRALGFIYRGWRWGRAKNSRQHALWTRNVTRHIVAEHGPPIEPPPLALAPPTLREILQVP